MNTQNTSLAHRSATAIAEESARFMSSVYRWMTGGLLTTGAVAYWVGNTPELVEAIVMNRMLFWALIIAQFGSVIWLSAGIRKMSALTATSIFFAYSALVGLTLSVIFLILFSLIVGVRVFSPRI